MGPMGAQRERSGRAFLDGMVGYDPEDPVTAMGVGKVEGSYTKYLNRNGLKGARASVSCASSIGNNSEPRHR